MIQSYELDYVSMWPNKVPYPQSDYIEQTKKAFFNAFNLYMDLYKGIKYNICFSNSTEINLEIFEHNVAHMLGIDCSNIKSTFHDTFRSSVLDINPSYNIPTFHLLKKIIDNFDNIVEYETTGNKTKILNYYRIFIKSCIFERLVNLSNFNYICINFDKNEYANNCGANCNFNSTKFLAIESEETCAPYFLMGILEDSKKNTIIRNGDADTSEIFDNRPQSNSYAVETLIAPRNAKDFIANQEVILPTHLVYSRDGGLKRTEATPEQKLALLKMYKSMLDKYCLNTSRIDLSGDYGLLLGKEIHNKRLTNNL